MFLFQLSPKDGSGREDPKARVAAVEHVLKLTAAISDFSNVVPFLSPLVKFLDRLLGEETSQGQLFTLQVQVLS